MARGAGSKPKSKFAGQKAGGRATKNVSNRQSKFIGQGGRATRDSGLSPQGPTNPRSAKKA